MYAQGNLWPPLISPWCIPIKPYGTETYAGGANAPTNANPSTANRAVYQPFRVQQTMTITDLKIVANSASITGNYDIGLYNHGTGGPSSRIASRGSTAMTTNVNTWTPASPITLAPGLYYVATAFSTATSACSRLCWAPSGGPWNVAPLYYQLSALALPDPATPVNFSGSGLAVQIVPVICTVSGVMT